MAGWLGPAIMAAGMLGSAGVGAMGGKKNKGGGQQSNPNMDKLASASTGLIEEGAPLRERMLSDVLSAWLSGGTPRSLTPGGQQRRSNISAEGDQTRESTRARLDSQGLLNSSYGNQVMGDIDREIANMLVGNETADLENLLALAPQIAWQGVPGGISGLSAVSGQGTQMQMQQGLMDASAQSGKSQMMAGIGRTIGGVGLSAFLPGMQTSISNWMNRPSTGSTGGGGSDNG